VQREYSYPWSRSNFIITYTINNVYIKSRLVEYFVSFGNDKDRICCVLGFDETIDKQPFFVYDGIDKK
jgi:hypothetical protein